MDIKEFLLWVANSGGSIAIVSWIFEKWSWYQSKESSVKQWIFFGVSFLVTVIAYLILTYVPTNVISMIAPYFMFAYATFTTVFAGELFHKNVNKK